MIAIMTMNHTTISEESVDELAQEYDRDAQLLFVGADPRKARLLSLETEDDMPDTSYDYDMELYGNGES
uniref:Uncharacterized protein n=1 Tax=Moniliophthora roreri TaxID=221103 RepID=A0A0W0F0Y4_MONRR